ncbi:hypothetical protein DXG01_007061 [Tephrocybe rancida]|nr:hypothetical protein DXG01_007061 [Tephrocybe rancida]
MVLPHILIGNIVDFLQGNPEADRRSLIINAASGLSYLHDNGIVHGTVHGQNILIASTSPLRACLADSGFASVIDAHLGSVHKYSRYGMAGMRAASQFLAPEDELSGSSISRTQASDVYAFATSSHMIFMDGLPLEHELSSRSLIRPREQIYRDRGLSDVMWQLMENSWLSDPERRPSAGQIVAMLKKERNVLLKKVTALLRGILSGAELYKRLLACSGADAQEALDAFQWLLDTDNFQDRAWLIAAMRRISESMNLFPARFSLKTQVPVVEDQAVAAGSFADIFKVNLQGKQMCLKVIRISGQAAVEHIMKIFTEQPPFFETKRPLAILTKILSGATPTRPGNNDPAWQEHGLNNSIWDLMQDCWKTQPSERLDITEVISRLGGEKPIDSRPPSDWEGGVPILFRDAQAYLSKDPVSVLEGLDRLLSQVASPGI